MVSWEYASHGIMKNKTIRLDRIENLPEHIERNPVRGRLEEEIISDGMHRGSLDLRYISRARSDIELKMPVIMKSDDNILCPVSGRSCGGEIFSDIVIREQIPLDNDGGCLFR